MVNPYTVDSKRIGFLQIAFLKPLHRIFQIYVSSYIIHITWLIYIYIYIHITHYIYTYYIYIYLIYILHIYIYLFIRWFFHVPQRAIRHSPDAPGDPGISLSELLGPEVTFFIWMDRWSPLGITGWCSKSPYISIIIHNYPHIINMILILDVYLYSITYIYNDIMIQLEYLLHKKMR